MRRAIVRSAAAVAAVSAVVGGLAVGGAFRGASAQTTGPVVQLQILGKVPAAITGLDLRVTCTDAADQALPTVTASFPAPPPSTGAAIGSRAETGLPIPTEAVKCAFVYREQSTTPSPTFAILLLVDGSFPTLSVSRDAAGYPLVSTPPVAVTGLKVVSLVVRYPTVFVQKLVPGLPAGEGPAFPMTISCSSSSGTALPPLGPTSFSLRNNEVYRIGTDDFRDLAESSVCVVTETDSGGYVPSGRGSTGLSADRLSFTFAGGVATDRTVRVETRITSLLAAVEITNTPPPPSETSTTSSTTTTTTATSTTTSTTSTTTTSTTTTTVAPTNPNAPLVFEPPLTIPPVVLPTLAPTVPATTPAAPSAPTTTVAPPTTRPAVPVSVLPTAIVATTTAPPATVPPAVPACQLRFRGFRPGQATVTQGRNRVARLVVARDGTACLQGLPVGTYTVTISTRSGRLVAYRVTINPSGPATFVRTR